MNRIGNNILKSIIEGKWLNIEYQNAQKTITKYWIRVNSFDVASKKLDVDGFNIMKSPKPIPSLKIHFDSILSSEIVEGTFYPKNEALIQDIYLNEEKYSFLFFGKINLKILDYLAECHRLDATPYKSDFLMLSKIDEQTILKNEEYSLDDEQFRALVARFQYNIENNCETKYQYDLCMNVLSCHTAQGLYVLAYRKLRLDILNQKLRADLEILVNREFTIEGSKYSIRKFIPEEDSALLDDFDVNRSAIIDLISEYIQDPTDITDSPFIIGLGSDLLLDLNNEYNGIVAMYAEDRVTEPIKAFFGEIKAKPVIHKNYPITLLSNRINLDQLLAIHKTLKYPVTYVQGPPGTGKTNTIINTLLSAFFSEKTVLVSSYNNHPMDGVFEKLRELTYKGLKIPFPVIRLGNRKKVSEALDDIKSIYESVKEIRVFSFTLDRNKEEQKTKVKQLSTILEQYEEKLDLFDRKETIERMTEESNGLFNFNTDLRSGQLSEIDKRLLTIGNITNEDAIALLETDFEEFKKFLYYNSTKYFHRLKEPKNSDLLEIINMDDLEKRTTKFNQYLSSEENMRKFIRIFPVVITTNVSAHLLGAPRPYFDLTIIDEASQCSNAVSLIPIIRGENLLLVGDPQQLNPVIVLDPNINRELIKKYTIPSEYDYIENSIYKTYLAVDAISDEILLSYHYRCNKKIIDFNNKKYYNNKLVVKSESQCDTPLIFIDTPSLAHEGRNTSLPEANEIIAFIKENPGKKIGVITPFVKQKELINDLLRENEISDITCGTVHAFQGDEKDIILFSTAITAKTQQKTYDWLKNNKELINVATSRAKDQLVLLTSKLELDRLNAEQQPNDFWELCEYVRNKGESHVSVNGSQSRALGFKPYGTDIEMAFHDNLNQALGITNSRCVLRKEVPISLVFPKLEEVNDIFYTGRFDFVVYGKTAENREYPLFAIELNGIEHETDERVIARDEKKKEICKKYNFKLISIKNTFARRYNHIKDILMEYFQKK